MAWRSFVGVAPQIHRESNLGEARKGDLPIAILPITEVTSTEDPNEQHTRLATFLADAFNESIRHLAQDADTPGA